MKKLSLLRQHLAAAIPGMARDPDRLLTFIENGAIEFHPTRTQPNAAPSAYSHEYAAPARIVITDYNGDLDAVIVPLLQWLAHYEPGLDPQRAIQFDADLIDAKTWDLSITVTLTERVLASADCATGRIEVEHRIPEYPVDACPVSGWEIWLKGPADPAHYLIAQWDPLAPEPEVPPGPTVTLDTMGIANDGIMPIIAVAGDGAVAFAISPDPVNPPLPQQPVWLDINAGQARVPYGASKVYAYAIDADGRIGDPTEIRIASSNIPFSVDFRSEPTTFYADNPQFQFTAAAGTQIGSGGAITTGAGLLELHVPSGAHSHSRYDSIKLTQQLGPNRIHLDDPSAFPEIDIRVKAKAPVDFFSLGNFAQIGVSIGGENSSTSYRFEWYNQLPNSAFYSNIAVLHADAASALETAILRIVVGPDRTTINLYYSEDDGLTWLGPFTGDLGSKFAGSLVLYGASDSTGPAFTAGFEYIENSHWPIPKGGGPWTITPAPSGTGSGNVTLWPSKTSYADGEIVYAEVIPDAGSDFVAWQDALTQRERWLRVTKDLVLAPVFDLITTPTITLNNVANGAWALDFDISTASKCTIQVDVGTAPDYAAVSGESPEGQLHAVVVDGLTPGTAYDYRIRALINGNIQDETTGSITTSTNELDYSSYMLLDGGFGDKFLQPGTAWLTMIATINPLVRDKVRVRIDGTTYRTCHYLETNRLGNNQVGFEWLRGVLSANIPTKVEWFGFGVAGPTCPMALNSITFTQAPAPTQTTRTIDFTAMLDPSAHVQVMDGDWILVDDPTHGKGLQVQTKNYDRIAVIPLPSAGVRGFEGSLDVLCHLTAVSTLTGDNLIAGIIFGYRGHPKTCTTEVDIGCETQTDNCLESRWFPHQTIPCIRTVSGAHDASVYEASGAVATVPIAESFVDGVTYYLRTRIWKDTDGVCHSAVKHWRATDQEPAGWETVYDWPTNIVLTNTGNLGILNHYMDPILHSVTITRLP